MTKKNEALLLADALGNLEATGYSSDSVSLTDRSEAIADAAAAELRRLVAENQRCRDVFHATSDGWRADAEEWTAQRDALLEALNSFLYEFGDKANSATVQKARAAIKNAEGEQ